MYFFPLLIFTIFCWAWVFIATQAFSNCGEQTFSMFIEMCGLLTSIVSPVVGHWLQGAWASVVAAPGLLEHRVTSCGAWALLPYSMWDLPGPGLEPCISRWILNLWTIRKVRQLNSLAARHWKLPYVASYLSRVTSFMLNSSYSGNQGMEGKPVL